MALDGGKNTEDSHKEHKMGCFCWKINRGEDLFGEIPGHFGV